MIHNSRNLKGKKNQCSQRKEMSEDKIMLIVTILSLQIYTCIEISHCTLLIYLQLCVT